MGLDLARRPRWRTVGSSVAGTVHAKAGDACADAWAVKVLGGRAGRGVLVAAVADGAGTSAEAAAGATLACEAVLQSAERWHRRGRRGRLARVQAEPAFGRADAVHWIEAARDRIADAALARRRQCRDFSCTLLVSVVDEASAAFFQIGDGAIVYRDGEGAYRPALWPQTGEYANCTRFVTDDDAVERVQWASVRGVDEVALFTDGLQRLALRFASREAHGPFFEPLFAHLRQPRPLSAARLGEGLRAFLDSPAVNQRTDDDKTLVLATRLDTARSTRTRGGRGER